MIIQIWADKYEWIETKDHGLWPNVSSVDLVIESECFSHLRGQSSCEGQKSHFWSVADVQDLCKGIYRLIKV